MQVLVVDDDDAVRHMLQLAFELEGVEVVLAQNGHRALEIAAAERPDVIVLDVMMPEFDGWDVANALGADPATSDIPIVFCTALSDTEDTWQGWRMGASSYVPKPFDTVQLVEEVLKVAAATRSV